MNVYISRIMAKQRFSPEFLTSQHTQLQKQIYLKEERFLGLPNQKKNLSQLFSQVPRETMSLSPTPNSYLSKEISKTYSKSPTKPIIPLKKHPFEQVYRTRISIATKVKEKFDFKNRSPISWLSKEDNFYSPIRPKPNLYKDFSLVSHQLNTKKVIKGMGYEKSFIFSQ